MAGQYSWNVPYWATEVPWEIDRLKKVNADLLEALKWIHYEASQYADGAEDAHYLAKFLTEVEQRARAAIQRAEETG